MDSEAAYDSNKSSSLDRVKRDPRVWCYILFDLTTTQLLVYDELKSFETRILSCMCMLSSSLLRRGYASPFVVPFGG